MQQIALKIKQVVMNLRISVMRKGVLRHHNKMVAHKARRDALARTFTRLLRVRAGWDEA